MQKSSTELRLEVERVNLLYQQNITGFLNLMALGGTYLYVTWDIGHRVFLVAWAIVLFTSGLLRVLATLRWRKVKSQLSSFHEVKLWLNIVQALLLVSGLCWGAIAFLMPTSPSMSQQVITSMIVVMMGVGAVVAYSASLRAMIFVFWSSMIPWAVGLAISGNPVYEVMSGLVLLYLILGTYAGRTLSRYVLSSLELSVEKEEAREALRKSQQNLNLALKASGSGTWVWNSDADVFHCDSNMLQILGLELRSWTGSLYQFVQFVHEDDRAALMAKFKLARELETEFEIEYRVSFENQLRYVSQRGRVSGRSNEGDCAMAGILLDVTDKKLQEQRQKELNEFEAESKAKSIFLANASHEIRTPLAAINGFADLLLQDHTMQSESRRDVQMILRNGKYLSSLVSDLLDLSEIESGQIYIEKNQMSPVREINDIAHLMRPLIQSRGLKLIVEYKSRIPASIESDSTRFREIMSNLLSNAAKFTEVGKIKVSVSYDSRPKEGCLRIVVADTGIGISPEGIKRLFRPFSRGESEKVQRVQGSGLGLALSRNLARLIGGDIHLARSKEGEGSVFEFTLSTGPIAETNYIFPDDEDSNIHDTAVSKKTQPLEGTRILVVDDAADLQFLMQRLLESKGATVEIRSNGQEAIDQLKDHDYDLVLMDIKMPVMDGYTAASYLRKHGYRAPLIAVTAHASADDRQLCYQAGFDAYVSKPVDFKQLTENILKQLER